MAKGSVKFFNAAKGFGFITPEDGGKDVFVPAASIAASGLAKLKAGQRVSYDSEPDPKGPKAVNLVVLEEPKPAPQPAPVHAAPNGFAPAPAHVSQPVRESRPAGITLYHDPSTDEDEDVLDALADAGQTARVIDIIAAPPTRDELRQLSLLLRDADQSLVRRYHPMFLALQLDDRFISEGEFWTAIAEHPVLVNAPVLATAGKARICRTADDVKSFLGLNGAANSNRKPKGLSPRMAAMMQADAAPTRGPARAPVQAPAPSPASASAAVAAPVAEPEETVRKIVLGPRNPMRLAARAEAAMAEAPEEKAAAKMGKPAPKAVAKTVVKAKAPAAKAPAKVVAKKAAPVKAPLAKAKRKN